MAQLTQLKHRIKAIETIKKITHAMRLISISTHARLKNKEAALQLYTSTLNTLYHTIKKEVPAWHHPTLNPAPHEGESHPLIIIIGSEKGLCGSFNTMLFQFLRATLRTYKQKPDVMIVGRKTLDYIENVTIGPIIKTYTPLNMNTLSKTAEDIVHDIMNFPTPYTHITVVSNKFRSFFVQQPHITRLIPFDPVMPREHVMDTADYIWEQNPEELLTMITQQCVQATVHTLLFHSLLSEQAARFLSMDSSTRSAEGLLEQNKLQYNKLRQAKITKELTELTGGF
jgi:F-type H+-transporting ATPase subunit gamma